MAPIGVRRLAPEGYAVAFPLPRSLPRKGGREVEALPLLQVQDVKKSFGGIKAVAGCSFAVEANSITALIGPNGAGKTTIFNMINGLYRADGGAILFRDERIDRLQPH